MDEVELRVETYGANFDFLVQEWDSTNQEWDVVDISGATRKNLVFTRPDRTQLIVAATFKTSGVDGYLRWAITEGQIRKQDAGIWHVEADLAGISGWTGPSRTASFPVQGRLKR